MAISRSRKARKTPPDLRYYPYFPLAYREFIKTVPYEFRVHVKKEVDGGSDIDGDGSFEKPFANVEYAINYVVNKTVAAPWTKWGFIIYPGTYTAKGTVNPKKSKHPDYRVNLFTDTFQNPIPKLPDSQRYTITTTTTTSKSGKEIVKTTKTDNYAGHAFMSTPEWTYNFQFIGAGGNTRIDFQTYPYYYNPSTKKFWNVNEAIAGNEKLAYLGIYPKFYNTANRANVQGGFTITEQNFSNVAIPFTVAEDGNYVFRYYTERRADNTLYRIPTHYGNTLQKGLFFDERHAWYYLNTTNTNPTGNSELFETGNIYINGTALIEYDTGKFGNCLSLNGGGFYVPYEANSILDIGTSDFTIEMYVKLGRGTVTGPLFSNYRSMTREFSYEASISSEALRIRMYHLNSITSARTTTLRSKRLSRDVWYHVAFARSGTTAYLFLNGALVDTQTTFSGTGVTRTPVAYSFPTNRPGTFYVGSSQTSTIQLFLYNRSGNVFVDEVRVSNVFRYLPANVTVPTTAFLNDSDTVALFSLDKNLSDNNSPDTRVETIQILPPRGTAVITPYAFNNESGNVANSILTKTGSWLNVDYNSRHNLNNIFTIEFWALVPKTINGTMAIITKDGNPNKKSFAIELGPYIRIKLSYYGTAWDLDHTFYDRSFFNTFNHFVISKNGGQVRLFKNGYLLSTVSTVDVPLFASDANVYIGSSNDIGTNSDTIVINNLRIADNVYIDSNYTLPAVDLSPTEHTDTVLLIGQTGNVLTDASPVNNIVRNKTKNSQNFVGLGSNVAAIPVVPFATSGYSAYWPGTTNTYYSIDSGSVSIIAESTWTIEGFFRYTNYPRSSYVTLATNSSNDRIIRNQFKLYVDGETLKLNVIRSILTSDEAQATGFDRAIPLDSDCGTILNGWNHFALVNDVGVLKVFLNGVQTITLNAGFGTGISVNSLPVELIYSQGLIIGRGKNLTRSGNFNGYISNYRISDIAQYNTNFTVPNTQFVPSGSDVLLFLNNDNWRSTVPGLVEFGTITDTTVSPFSALESSGSHLLLKTELVSANKKTETVALGTGDFTIEGYYYKYGQVWDDKTYFFSLRGASIAGQKFQGSVFNVEVSIINRTSEKGYYIVVPNGAYADKTSSMFVEVYKYTELPPTNKWIHVALVRKDAVMTLFIDGVAIWMQVDQGFNLVKSYVVIGGRETENKFAGLVSNFRISKTARYSSLVNISQDPFVSNSIIDPYYENVGVLAHFETENYKRRPAASPKNSPLINFGHSNNIFLQSAVTHTLYTSAYNFNYQGVFGFDVTDKNNNVIFESRNLPRDHNLGLMLHPESSVRGIHVRYDAAKAFYYQHALFNSHSVGPGPRTWIPPKRTKGGKYDPKGPGAKGMYPSMVTLKKKDPATGTTVTVTEQGLKSLDLKSQLYGKFINVGIEGVELTLKSAGGGGPILMDRCTFRFANTSYFPTYNINVTGVMDIGPSANQGNLYIKNSVFGGPDANSLPRSKFQSNYITIGAEWWKKPKWPKFAFKPDLNQRVPVIRKTFFGANIAANTFTIVNSPIPPGFTIAGLTFKVGRNPSERYVNDASAVRTLIPAILKGATTVGFRDANANVLLHGTASTGSGSLYFPPTTDTLTPTQQLALLSGYPYVVTNSSLQNNTGNWKISLHLYHLGPFLGTLRYETIFISGRYVPPGKGIVFGDLLPGSWQLSARSYAAPLPVSAKNPVFVPATSRFQLELYRKGTPQSGDRAKFSLIGGDFRPNTWYKVDIEFNNSVVGLYVNNALIKETEYSDDIIKYPNQDYSLNSQYLFYLGKPPLYGQFWSPFRTRSWTGYIQYVRTFSGEDLTNNDVGVYSGAYKWVL